LGGITVNIKTINNLRYADDTVLAGNILTDTKKTKYMIITKKNVLQEHPVDEVLEGYKILSRYKHHLLIIAPKSRSV